MTQDKIALQNVEFDAARAFATTLYRCLNTPVVDDYPQMRYDYECALRSLMDAVRANKGRNVPPMYVEDSITLAHFAAINRARALRWHQVGGLSSWSLSDWFTALAGEVGELANVVKKLNRVRDGLQQNTVDPATLPQALADEIGDVFAYLDLFAQRAGLVLEKCARDKFNRISEREGFPERI